LANRAGAFGLAVAASGAFLAFTCGMASRADVRCSGNWYRGRLEDEPVNVSGSDGGQLRLSSIPEGYRAGAVTEPDRAPVLAAAEPAALADGLFRRDDADGVLGAVALPGNTLCAVKRTADGRFLPAGQCHIELTFVRTRDSAVNHDYPAPTARRQQ
jgi:hypothetical protein